MSEVDTRDIAMRADTKVDAHVQDCVRFRQVISDNFKDVRTDIGGLKDGVTKLQIKAAIALGALISAGKIIDWVLQWHK